MSNYKKMLDESRENFADTLTTLSTSIATGGANYMEVMGSAYLAVSLYQISLLERILEEMEKANEG